MVLIVPLMMLERKAVGMDAHEEKNEPNFCAVIVSSGVRSGEEYFCQLRRGHFRDSGDCGVER